MHFSTSSPPHVAPQILPHIYQAKKLTKKEKFTAESLAFRYPNEPCSEYLKCVAFLRVVTRLSLAFARGNHRVLKAFIALSGLHPTSADSTTWSMDNSCFPQQCLLQNSDSVKCLTTSLEFKFFCAKPTEKNWTDVVSAAHELSKQGAKNTENQFSLEIHGTCMYVPVLSAQKSNLCAASLSQIYAPLVFLFRPIIRLLPAAYKALRSVQLETVFDAIQSSKSSYNMMKDTMKTFIEDLQMPCRRVKLVEAVAMAAGVPASNNSIESALKILREEESVSSRKKTRYFPIMELLAMRKPKTFKYLKDTDPGKLVLVCSSAIDQFCKSQAHLTNFVTGLACLNAGFRMEFVIPPVEAESASSKDFLDDRTACSDNCSTPTSSSESSNTAESLGSRASPTVDPTVMGEEVESESDPKGTKPLPATINQELHGRFASIGVTEMQDMDTLCTLLMPLQISLLNNFADAMSAEPGSRSPWHEPYEAREAAPFGQCLLNPPGDTSPIRVAAPFLHLCAGSQPDVSPLESAEKKNEMKRKSKENAEDRMSKETDSSSSHEDQSTELAEEENATLGDEGMSKETDASSSHEDQSTELAEEENAKGDEALTTPPRKRGGRGRNWAKLLSLNAELRLMKRLFCAIVGVETPLGIMKFLKVIGAEDPVLKEAVPDFLSHVHFSGLQSSTARFLHIAFLILQSDDLVRRLNLFSARGLLRDRVHLLMRMRHCGVETHSNKPLDSPHDDIACYKDALKTADTDPLNLLINAYVLVRHALTGLGEDDENRRHVTAYLTSSDVHNKAGKSSVQQPGWDGGSVKNDLTNDLEREGGPPDESDPNSTVVAPSKAGESPVGKNSSQLEAKEQQTSDSDESTDDDSTSTKERTKKKKEEEKKKKKRRKRRRRKRRRK